MKDFPYIGGVEISKIQNREFIRIETDKAQAIVVALDKSNIPFSVRFSDAEMVLTFDGSYKDQVNEIIAKAQSGDHEILLRELQVYGVPDGYYRLLGEVAELLNTTVGALKNRPDEIQLALCKTYTDLWLCDDATIQRELDRIITVNGRTLQDIQEHEKSQNIPAAEYRDHAYFTRENHRHLSEMARQKIEQERIIKSAGSERRR